MPRTPRSDEPDRWHHVMNRGARRYDTFIDDADRRLFLRLMGEAAEAAEVELVAYCLMPNHFHLVVGCPRGGLSRSVQWLSANYTRAFNRRHGFDGPLFRSRFRSVCIDSDDYLLTATRYVHRNPLEIGLDIKGYPWSSYSAYRTGRPSPLLRNVDVVSALAGGTEAYAHFVETDLPSDECALTAGTRSILGSCDGRGLRPLDVVEHAVTSVTGATVEGLRRPGRGPNSTARMLAVLLACEAGSWSVSSIAERFGFTSPGSVRSTLSRARSRRQEDVRFRHHAEQARAALDCNGV